MSGNLRNNKEDLKNFCLNAFFGIIGFVVAHKSMSFFKINKNEENFLEINAEIEEGAYLELYINDDWENPRKLPIDKNNNGKYLFFDVPATISSIRLDPTDAASGNIRLNGIYAFCAQKKQLSPVEIDTATWKKNNCKINDEKNKILKIEVIGSDPFIWMPLNLRFSRNPLISIKKYIINNPSLAYFGVWLLVLSASPSLSIFNKLIKIIILTVLTYFCILTTLPTVIASTKELPDTFHSVGMATYNGYSFVSQRRGYLWILFCSLLIPAGILFLIRKISQK